MDQQVWCIHTMSIIQPQKGMTRATRQVNLENILCEEKPDTKDHIWIPRMRRLKQANPQKQKNSDTKDGERSNEKVWHFWSDKNVPELDHGDGYTTQ